MKWQHIIINPLDKEEGEEDQHHTIRMLGPVQAYQLGQNSDKNKKKYINEKCKYINYN
jgi:hypothetical protein